MIRDLTSYYMGVGLATFLFSIMIFILMYELEKRKEIIFYYEQIKLINDELNKRLKKR